MFVHNQTDEETEITYSEILGSVTLNGEVIITLMPEDIEKAKTGLKNLKAKQAAALKKEGLLPPTETLEFLESPSTEYENFVDLHIILKQKAAIKIKSMKIPSNEM